MKKNAKIGNSIIYLDSTDSTNNYVAKLVKDQKAEFGQVILADQQTAGKGQRDAKWVSEKGKNLLFSVYISLDNLSVTGQLAIMQYTAVSICEGLKEIGVEAQIKWPNDLYVRGKKMGGILVENQIIGSNIVSSIIGIGVNVNQVNFESIIASSIAEQLGKEQNRIQVLEILLGKLNFFYPFIENSSELLQSKYMENLYKLNTVATFYADSLGEFIGVITGVDEYGKLCVKHNNEVHRFDVKEIKFL